MTATLLDLAAAIEFLEGDGELCVELLDALLPVLEEAAAALPELLARRDWGAISSVAHKLAPSLRIFCPTAVEPAALNAAWQRRDCDSCETLAAQLMQLLLRLRLEVALWIQTRA